MIRRRPTTHAAAALSAAVLLLPVLAACSEQIEPAAADRPSDDRPVGVVIEATPPPPYTYWAPAGSTIRNHPRDAETWIAEGPGSLRSFYFGDACRASARQAWIGQSLNTIPDAAPGELRRTYCDACMRTDDLVRLRLNIAYDEATRTITSVTCG